MKSPEELSEDKKIKAALHVGTLSSKIRLNARNFSEANANPNKRVFDGQPVHSYEMQKSHNQEKSAEDKFHYHVFWGLCYLYLTLFR